MAHGMSTAHGPASLLVVPAELVPWRRRTRQGLLLGPCPRWTWSRGVSGRRGPGQPPWGFCCPFRPPKHWLRGMFSWAFQRSNPKSENNHAPFFSVYICGPKLSSSRRKSSKPEGKTTSRSRAEPDTPRVLVWVPGFRMTCRVTSGHFLEGASRRGLCVPRTRRSYSGAEKSCKSQLLRKDRKKAKRMMGPVPSHGPSQGSQDTSKAM